jgi:hypothetical protein
VFATTTTQLKMLIRRLAIPSLIAVLALLSGIGQEVHAGVIVPWENDLFRGETDLTSDVYGTVDFVGSTSAAADSAAAVPENGNRDGRSQRTPAMTGLVETTGGASSPVGSSGAQSQVVPAAIFDAAVAPLVTWTFGRLCGRSPELPHPPLGELLDPPKACV